MSLEQDLEHFQSRMRSQLAQLQAELEENKRERARAEKSAQDYQAMLESLEVELLQANTKMAALRGQLAEGGRFSASQMSALEQRAHEAETEVARLEGLLVTRQMDESQTRNATMRQELEALLEMVGVPAVSSAQDVELQAAQRLAQEAQATVALLKFELSQEAEVAARLAQENARLRFEVAALKREGPNPHLPALPEQVAMAEAERDANRELQRLAFEDALTRLPNLQLGRRYLQQEVEKAQRGSGTVALAMVDIDRLRSINELLGREVGDELLRQLPARLVSCLKPEDVVVRGREDEFWIIAPSPTRGPLGIKNLTQRLGAALTRLLEQLKQPFSARGHTLVVTVGCGVALTQGQEAAELLERRCWTSLQAAKRAGRNRVADYQPELEKLRQKHAALEAPLRQAIEGNQFVMRYQPIYDLKSHSAWGAEALLRWNHPQRGLTDAGEFMEAARELGLILPIGDWVVREVCQVGKLLGDVFITLNLSAQELMQADFVRRFTRAIEAARGLRPERLVVEVNEADFAGHNLRLADALRELRRWNVQVAVDDFSFDTLSLRRVQELKLNYLKVHPQLVAQMETLVARNLVRTAVVAAESIGCRVIAECVETPAQLDMLAEVGCHLGQGSYLSPPVLPGGLHERAQLRRAR